jgi:hypothetical protein
VTGYNQPPDPFLAWAEQAMQAGVDTLSAILGVGDWATAFDTHAVAQSTLIAVLSGAIPAQSGAADELEYYTRDSA